MHGLRSNGDMNFEDITLMCPDIEFAHDVEGAELESEQRFHPRMYTTHFLYEACPKGEGKYIVLRRQDDLTGWMIDMLVQESKGCRCINVLFLKGLAV